MIFYLPMESHWWSLRGPPCEASQRLILGDKARFGESCSKLWISKEQKAAPKSRSEKLRKPGNSGGIIIYTILETLFCIFFGVAIGKNHLHCWVAKHAHMGLFETEGPQSFHEKYRKNGEDEVLSHCMEQVFPVFPYIFWQAHVVKHTAVQVSPDSRDAHGVRRSCETKLVSWIGLEMA